MSRYFNHTPYPLQLTASMSTPVEGVLVVTSRGQEEVLSLAERLLVTSLPAAMHEVIIVLYDSNYDEDLIAKRNTDHFWALSQAFSSYGHIHVLLWHHLPDENAAAAAVRIGMDEAAMRLENAGSADGWILHIPADVCWEGDLLWETHAHYSRPGAEALLTYPTQSLWVTHGNYLSELAYRYHKEGFGFAGLPIMTPFMALTQNGYLQAGGWPLESNNYCEWQHQLTQSHQMATATEARLLADFGNITSWTKPRWVDPYLFLEARNWHEQLSILYEVKELSGYGEWLKNVSPSIAAGLQEIQFFSFWKDCLLSCSTAHQFRTKISGWITPARALTLLLTASGRYTEELPQQSVARLLEIISGYPPERYDIVYLLERLRKMEATYWSQPIIKEKAG